MQAISHPPSGNQSMHKESHCDSNGYEPWYCNAVYSLPSLHLIPKVLFSPRRSGSTRGNANELYKLMSAQTHGERIGGLRCRVLSPSTTTTRPSKHTESFYSLTVLPPATTPPRGCCFLSLPLEWWQQWMRRHDYFFQTQKKESSFMPHWLCFLWLIFPFSSLPASRPPKPCAHTQTHIFLSTQPSPLGASPFLVVILTRRLSRRSSLKGSD